MFGRCSGARSAVNVDPRMVPGSVPRAPERHARNPSSGEIGRAFVAGVRSGQDEAVDVPAIDEFVVGGDLIVVGVGRVEHEAVVEFDGRGSECVQETVEDGITEVGLDPQPEHPRAARAQLLGRPMGPVAQRLDRRRHLVGRRLTDEFR